MCTFFYSYFFSLSQELWIQRRWHQMYSQFINEKLQQRVHGRPLKYESHLDFLKVNLSKMKATKSSINKTYASPEPYSDTDEFCVTQEEIDNYNYDKDEHLFNDVEINGNDDRMNESPNHDEIEVICDVDDDIELLEEPLQADLKNSRNNSAVKETKRAKVSSTRRNVAVKPKTNSNCKNEIASSDNTAARASLSKSMSSAKLESKDNANEQGISNSSDSHSQENGRCEDEIFGELVTAMLKRMSPQDKKRAKKEIMNILL